MDTATTTRGATTGMSQARYRMPGRSIPAPTWEPVTLEAGAEVQTRPAIQAAGAVTPAGAETGAAATPPEAVIGAAATPVAAGSGTTLASDPACKRDQPHFFT